MCYDRAAGKQLWKREVGLGAGNPPGRLNNMSSPSAVTDGKLVIFLFGTGDIAALDMDGKPLWSRNLQKEFGQWNMLYLYVASPLLYNGRLYVNVLHRNVPVFGRASAGEKPADSYLLVMDTATGRDFYRHIRPTDAVAESIEAYSTPMPYERDGRLIILIVGGNYLTGHNAEDGRELWRCGGWNKTDGHLRLVPTVTIADDLFIVCTPKIRGQVFAVKPGGAGDVTETHVAWRNREIASDVCTPLFYQGNLYVLDGDFRKGLSCLEPKTGQRKWFTPIPSRSVLRTSPTGADGKIYCANEAGDVWVISADDGKIISNSSLGSEGPTRASISASQGQVFLRTADKLYCFRK
jgi:outer membrane protein assembly factor BamB